MKYAHLLAMVLIAGCSAMDQDPLVEDQCLRREIFKECLQDVPRGPETTHNNAWDGVVSECASNAYKSAIRHQSVVKKECAA